MTADRASAADVLARAGAALQGVWNIVPTPFKPDGELDPLSLTRLTEFVVRSRVDGMTILGFMGEAGKLDDAERTVIIRGSVAAAGGRLPICVGISHSTTEQAIAFAHEAADLGAHSVMLAPPTLPEPTDEGQVRDHFLAVADAIDLPIVVQDYPPASGVRMSVELIAGIARAAPACRYLKLEDAPSPPKIARVRAADPSIAILGGLGASELFDELVAGAVGTMTGFGFPEILVDIVRRFRSGDRAGARAVYERYLPLIQFENQPGINLPIRKHLYRRRGAIASERARSPVPELEHRVKNELDAILRELDLADGLAPIEEPA